MIKINLATDEKKVNEYIKMLQEKFPLYEVNVNNANDFNMILIERENCKNCRCLSQCKNMNPGYVSEYDGNDFCYKPCNYLKEKNKESKLDKYINIEYLPKRILDAKLENFDVNTESRRKIYDKIISFVENPLNEKGLYLYGSFSIGKTYTLACIANELAKKNVESLLIYFPDLVLDLKNAIGTPRFERLMNRLKTVDVLMLDDLGSENMSAWLRDEVLGPVLNYRVLECKPLFISSNISPKEITNHFAIDKSPASNLKAERITTRIQASLSSINMDDCNKYFR